PYLDREEGYKDAVHARARESLDCGSWTQADFGTGKIAASTIRGIEVEGSNLLPWDLRYGAEARPHQPLYLAEGDPDFARSIETALYRLFRTNDDKASFEALTQLLGRKYSLLAYLMFLK